MILRIVYLFISIACSLTCIFCTPLSNDLLNLFWLLALIPGFYVAAFLSHMLIILIIGLFVDKKKPSEKPHRWAQWTISQATAILCDFTRIKIHFSGKEKLPKKQRYLFVTNHLSNYDMIVALAALNDNHLVYVSKPENFKIPLAGGMMALAGYTPINRENPFEGVKAIKRAARLLKEEDCSIGICPEGTRSKDHEFHEFHSGSFKIAIWGEAPIVLGAIQNSWAVSKQTPWRKTHVYFDILEVIPYETFKGWSTNEISEYCHKKIEEHLEAHKDRDIRSKIKQ